jgi:predicted branched-subunit amino acid permease
MFGLILTPYFCWAAGTLLGSAAGNVLPAVVVSALGIAIYAMFVAIVVPFARGSLSGLLCVALAMALSLAFKYLPVLNKVPSGFAIIICAVLASLVFAFAAPIKEEETDDE